MLAGQHIYKVYAECMHDYHKALVALRDGSDEVGVVELCLEKPDSGGGIIIQFCCNLHITQLRAIWEAAPFLSSVMNQTIALVPEYTGEFVPMDDDVYPNDI